MGTTNTFAKCEAEFLAIQSNPTAEAMREQARTHGRIEVDENGTQSWTSRPTEAFCATHVVSDEDLEILFEANAEDQSVEDFYENREDN